MLTLLATPIGNLEDLSRRAIKVLETADLLLCEDTRRTKILLDHLGIHGISCKSYHTFNESREIEAVLQNLRQEKNVVLVSDAGTPLISDPGFELVSAAIKEGFNVDTIPGPCSPIIALILSGLPCSRFQFIGFLPKAQGERKKLLEECCYYPGSTIAFESPHRIQETVEELKSINPKHSIALARELTKIHQEVLRGSSEEVFEKISKQTPRGEFILVIGPGSEKTVDLDVATQKVLLLYHSGTSLSEASHQIAEMYGLRKKQLYQSALSFIKN